MFYFSYRNKIRLRNAGFTIAIAFLIIIGLLVGGFFYLERYVVYTSDGARLEFPNDDTTLTVTNPTFSVTPDATIPTESMPPVVIETLTETGEVVQVNQLSGYYIPPTLLSASLDDALAPTDRTLSVMVDLASNYGNFYFTTSASGGNYSSAVNITAADALLADLGQREDVYLIAAIPAFQNSAQALVNANDGLMLSGGALWMDGEGCYWMDPSKASTLSYLETMAYAALTMGFDEIVYTDFYLPVSDNIIYGETSETAIVDAAAYLSGSAIAEQIAISFGSDDSALLAYGDRLYLESGNASLIALLTEEMPEDKKANEALVFLTSSRDTRFEGYGLIQPLEE